MLLHLLGTIALGSSLAVAQSSTQSRNVTITGAPSLVTASGTAPPCAQISSAQASFSSANPDGKLPRFDSMLR